MARPRGLIFLGEAQLKDGCSPEPPPNGALTAVLSVAPLLSPAAADRVVLALDLRLLSLLPP